MLIIFGGMPGVGKTMIARELARQIGATHVRIDSIEEAIRNHRTITRSLDEAGYVVAYAIARDNLDIGQTVIADCVNPLPVTRDSWLEIGRQAQVDAIEVEVICSDPLEHRRRVEMRASDSALKLPTWDEVVTREYQSWNREHVVLDTANRSVEESVMFLRQMISGRCAKPESLGIKD
jgi:predicted kinase